MEERRRSPRYPTGAGEFALLPVAVSVQVLDISPAGVLLRSHQPVKVGTRGRLRLTVGGSPFTAEVEVRRTALASAEVGNNGYRVGVMFVDIAPEQRQVIERFTRQ
jgi:hypothetical protein